MIVWCDKISFWIWYYMIIYNTLNVWYLLINHDSLCFQIDGDVIWWWWCSILYIVCWTIVTNNRAKENIWLLIIQFFLLECLLICCTSLHNVGGEVAYIASGGIDGEVKLWTINGENVGSWSHHQIITTIKAFKDDLGGEYLLKFLYWSICVNIFRNFCIDIWWSSTEFFLILFY